MRSLVLVLGMGLVTPPAAQGEALFTYKGTAVTAQDLTPAQQQTLYDLQLENRDRMQAFVDQVLLDSHFDALAKKLGKTRLQVEDEQLTPGEPSEKEVKAWYAANKERLPPGYKLEQIASDIKSLLNGEGKKKKRNELLAKLRKDGGLTLAVPEPVAPVLEVAIAGFPVKGDPAAPVTIVEFADYQCPHCKHAGEVLAKVLAKHKGKVKLVFLDYPVNQSGISRKVAYGAYCAEQQGKYWEYHEQAFKDQRNLGPDAANDVAKAVKLDDAQFKACMASKAPEERVAKARAEGDKIGVSGTPTILINGRKTKAHDEAGFDSEIAKALSKG